LPISAADTISLAFQHTKRQLFQPFRFWQWTRLAVVGLLAAESGCGQLHIPSNFTFPPQGGHRHFSFAADAWPNIDPAILGSLITVLVIAGLVLFVVLSYISSVMRFVLFDSVLTKQCRIREGWRRRQSEGWRYFLWKAGLGLIGFGCFVVLIGIPLGMVFLAGWLKQPSEHLAALVLGGIVLFSIFLGVVIIFATVQVLTKDFVVPQMAFEDIGAVEGWRRLLAMMKQEQGGYLVYIILKIAMAIGVGIILGVVILVMGLFIAIPTGLLGILAAVAGKSAGMTWDAYTITLAIVLGCMVSAGFLYLVALISVPAIVFFPAYAMHFFAGRYQPLNAALYGLPPAPEPPMLPVAQPIG
jgi:hypothetical protein